jgi:hypothetical protein
MPINLIRSPLVPDSVTVGNTPTAVLPATSARPLAILVNISDETIFLGFGQDAILNKGVALVANGGSFAINDFSHNIFNGTVNAICASGGKTLTLQVF